MSSAGNPAAATAPPKQPMTFAQMAKAQAAAAAAATASSSVKKPAAAAGGGGPMTGGAPSVAAGTSSQPPSLPASAASSPPTMASQMRETISMPSIAGSTGMGKPMMNFASAAARATPPAVGAPAAPSQTATTPAPAPANAPPAAYSNGRPSNRMSFTAAVSTGPNYASMAQRTSMPPAAAAAATAVASGFRTERKPIAGNAPIQFGSISQTVSPPRQPSLEPASATLPTPPAATIAPAKPTGPTLASIVAATAAKPTPAAQPAEETKRTEPAVAQAPTQVVQPAAQKSRSGAVRTMPDIPRTMSAPPELDQEGQLPFLAQMQAEKAKAAAVAPAPAPAPNPAPAQRLGPQNAWSKPIQVRSKLSQDIAAAPTAPAAQVQQQQPPTAPASMQQQQRYVPQVMPVNGMGQIMSPTQQHQAMQGMMSPQSSAWGMQQQRSGPQGQKMVPGQPMPMPGAMAMSPQQAMVAVAGSPSMIAGIPNMPGMGGSPHMAAGAPGWQQYQMPFAPAGFPPNFDPQQAQAYYQQMYMAAAMNYGHMRPGMMPPMPAMPQQSPSMTPGLPPSQTTPQQVPGMPPSPRSQPPLFSPPPKGMSRAIKIVNPNTGEVLNTSAPSTPKTPAHVPEETKPVATAADVKTSEPVEQAAKPTPPTSGSRAISIVNPDTKKPVELAKPPVSRSSASSPPPSTVTKASEIAAEEPVDSIPTAEASLEGQDKSNNSDGASVASELVSKKKRKKKKKKKGGAAGSSAADDGEDDEQEGDQSIPLDETPVAPESEPELAIEQPIDETAAVVEEPETLESAVVEESPIPAPITTSSPSEQGEDVLGDLPSSMDTTVRNAPLSPSMSTPITPSSGTFPEGTEPKRKASMPPPGLGMPPGLGGSGTPIGPGFGPAIGPGSRLSASGTALKIPPGLPGLEMSRTTSAPGSQPSPSGGLSAAMTLRSPDKLDSVKYPPNIKSPFANAQASEKLKYNITFLREFMDIIKDKPSGMNVEVMEDSKSGEMGRTQSGGRRGARQSMPAKAPPPGINTDPTKMSSEERFIAASLRSGGQPGRTFSQSGGPGSMQRTSSGGMGMPDRNKGQQHGRSQRGGRQGGGGRRDQQGGPTIPMDQVAPLAMSDERWKAKEAEVLPKDSPEVVQRKVKSLLNKLTLEKFDSISEQIVEFANMSSKESDGFTLRLVIQLVFEKATDEPNFSALYAKLAHKMLTSVSPDVLDENVRNKDGQVMGGGPLFRKYLLNRCQEEFEKGWKANLTDNATPEELLSDEYYIAMKAKRRGLGLIQFIGELFKLEMLTEKIMHECVRRLLSNVQDPEEEETESLCKLMITVGKRLDRPEAKGFMDVYFGRIRELSQNKKLISRIRFMLQDLLELRNEKWVPRRAAAGPKTIAEIHKDAIKAKEEAEAARRSHSSGRGMPPVHQMHGGGRGRRDSVNKDQKPSGQFPPPDGWSTVGGGPASANAPPQSRKTSDLSGFGNLSRTKNAPVGGLGPGGSTFFGGIAAASKSKEDHPASGGSSGSSRLPPGFGKASTVGVKAGTALTANAFSALMEGSEVATSPPREAASSPPKERRKLLLIPRSTSGSGAPATSEVSLLSRVSDAPPAVSKLTKQQAKLKIENLINEYLSVKDLEEVVLSVKELGVDYIADFIDACVDVVVNKKVDDVTLAAQMFDHLLSTGTVTAEQMYPMLKEKIKAVDDLSLDVPQAHRYVALLVYGSQMPLSVVTRAAMAIGGFGQQKFLGEFLRIVKEKEGVEVLKKRVETDKFDLHKAISRSGDVIADFLDRYGLFELAPSYAIVKPLKKMFGTDEADAIITYFEKNVPIALRNSPEFVRVMATAFIRYMAGHTIFADGFEAPSADPSPKIEAKEREIFGRYKELLIIYASAFKSVPVRVALLQSAAAFAEEHKYPKDWLVRFLSMLKESRLVDKELMGVWRNHERKAMRFDLLAQIEEWYKTLS